MIRCAACNKQQDSKECWGWMGVFTRRKPPEFDTNYYNFCSMECVIAFYTFTLRLMSSLESRESVALREEKSE